MDSFTRSRKIPITGIIVTYYCNNWEVIKPYLISAYLDIRPPNESIKKGPDIVT